MLPWASSDKPTQLADAVFRAQFWSGGHEGGHGQSGPPEGRALGRDWHTLLDPQVMTPRVMVLPHGSYRFALNSDGSCCAFVLVDVNTFASLLFPSSSPVDASTPIGAAELAGEMTTTDITTLLFPNTFLFDGTPESCCTVGFHSYDLEPGDASNGNRERRFVMNYSSWVSPGLFGDSFSDVTPLSHEISETYSDPFVVSDGVHNATPFWLAPNQLCQNNLESGDVIEGLPNATFPVTVDGFTYHPQNEALLSWFAFESPSSAINGAYSFPDETVLKAPSAPQRAGCAPAPAH
jgi:hypothetical protein